MLNRAVGAAVLIGVLNCSVASSQASDQTKWTFDVVSLKPTGPNVHFMGPPQGTPDDFRAFAATVRDLVCFAYDLQCTMVMSGSGDPRLSYVAHPPDLAGDEGWVGTEQFDLIAKVDQPLLEEWKKLPPADQDKRLKQMVQAILVDRCQLKVHTEKRKMPVYALVVAKGGAKVVPSRPDSPADPDHLQPDSRPLQLDLGLIKGHGLTMDTLAEILWSRREIGSKKVINRTGLTSKYDFKLEWTPEGDPADAGGPSIFTAIQEQLGLKLEPVKAPMDVVVIDHVEKPSQN